jgi:hypothetical protein
LFVALMVLLMIELSLAQIQNSDVARSYFLRSERGSHFIWRRKEDLPEKRSDFAITTDPSTGLTYLVGGCSADSFPDCPQTSKGVWEYNPTEDKYTVLPSLSVNRYRHGAAVLGDNLIVFAGFIKEGVYAQPTEILNLKTKTCMFIPSPIIVN